MSAEKKMVKARDLKEGQRVFLPADRELDLSEVRGEVWSEWIDGFYSVWDDDADDEVEVPADGDELVEVIE